MSAFDIYLVMQADAFGNAFVCLTFLVFAVMVIVAALYGEHLVKPITRTNPYKNFSDPAEACYYHEKFLEQEQVINQEIDERKAGRKIFWKYMKPLVPLFLLMFTASWLVPSTKTLAAMLVLPAIVNNETVQEDASEIYGLALEGLRKAVEDER